MAPLIRMNSAGTSAYKKPSPLKHEILIAFVDLKYWNTETVFIFHHYNA